MWTPWHGQKQSEEYRAKRFAWPKIQRNELNNYRWYTSINIQM